MNRDEIIQFYLQHADEIGASASAGDDFKAAEHLTFQPCKCGKEHVAHRDGFHSLFISTGLRVRDRRTVVILGTQGCICERNAGTRSLPPRSGVV
jgi:hypothetical protein